MMWIVVCKSISAWYLITGSSYCEEMLRANEFYSSSRRIAVAPWLLSRSLSKTRTRRSDLSHRDLMSVA